MEAHLSCQADVGVECGPRRELGSEGLARIKRVLKLRAEAAFDAAGRRTSTA